MTALMIWVKSRSEDQICTFTEMDVTCNSDNLAKCTHLSHFILILFTVHKKKSCGLGHSLGLLFLFWLFFIFFFFFLVNSCFLSFAKGVVWRESLPQNVVHSNANCRLINFSLLRLNTQRLLSKFVFSLFFLKKWWLVHFLTGVVV